MIPNTFHLHVDLDLLCWSGPSLNTAKRECLWRSKSAMWWAWTKWLSYCNSCQGWDARIQSITWKSLESRLSHGTHQRADSRMTSSFPLILKESRMGTSGLRCSVNPNAVLECPHPSSSLEFSPTLTPSSPWFLASAVDSQLLFPPPLSQLAGKLRPLRVSIDLMNEIVPLSWHPWNLVRSHSRCLHTYKYSGRKRKKTLVASQTVR